MSGIGGNTGGVMLRLLHDRSGNTIAMVAAAMIPLAGLIGGGIDMSRMYLTKTRLQQACDAGALAGRKVMGSNTWTYNSNVAPNAAIKMFDANFAANAYGTGTMTRSFSENAGTVTGTASVPLNMSLMKIFGIASKTISVNCEAQMRIPNTDVMFVLDTTGSMGSTNPGDSAPKIDGLKKAVKCFYEALAKYDINDVDCGSTPSGGNGTQVQLRFGFVPYSVNVNVGRLLNNDWMADNWSYQSREWKTSGFTWTPWENWSGAGSCPSNSSTVEYRYLTSSGGWNPYCSGQRRMKVTGNYWVYKQVSFNVSGLKAGGTTWNNSINLPLGNNGGNTGISWPGCIEERQTVRNTDGDPSDEFSPIPAAAFDLDIDMVPTSDPATQWGPLLPNAVWGRYDSTGASTMEDYPTSANLSRNYSSACPNAAAKLSTYGGTGSTFTTNQFRDYVNALSPTGNTYHDIGILWGARLMSPTGIFASENATTPGGGQIARNMIFMTDGDTQAGNQNYNAYGVPWWDRRQTDPSTPPSSTLVTAEVDARFPALCTAVKNKNITLWVVSFGTSVSNTAANRLRDCATSPQHFFTAANTATLIQNFRQIADNISQLRLTN